MERNIFTVRREFVWSLQCHEVKKGLHRSFCHSNKMFGQTTRRRALWNSTPFWTMTHALHPLNLFRVFSIIWFFGRWLTLYCWKTQHRPFRNVIHCLIARTPKCTKAGKKDEKKTLEKKKFFVIHKPLHLACFTWQCVKIAFAEHYDWTEGPKKKPIENRDAMRPKGKRWKKSRPPNDSNVITIAKADTKKSESKWTKFLFIFFFRLRPKKKRKHKCFF